MKRVAFLVSLSFALLLSGCSNDDEEEERAKTYQTVGLYVLSEGSMGNGDGQLAYFDYNSTKGVFVMDENKQFQNYGETTNDLLIYGSKMYCAITGDATTPGIVRVINVATGATIQDITITKDAATLKPRRLTASGGKIYVSLYPSAVAQIDTLSYSTKATALSGTFSEGICSYGSSLYICNSGQGTGNTISVVDMAQLTEKETITVPYNPMNIVSAGNGELYFNTASIWSGPAAGPANLHVLNTSTKQVTRTLDVVADFVAAGKNYIYTSATDWDEYESVLKKVSIADKSVSDFTADVDDVIFAYKVSVNPLNGEVFVTQQMGDFIYRYKEDGTYIETLETGKENGAAVVFVNSAW